MLAFERTLKQHLLSYRNVYFVENSTVNNEHLDTIEACYHEYIVFCHYTVVQLTVFCSLTDGHSGPPIVSALY